jgi:hypothetical protein
MPSTDLRSGEWDIGEEEAITKYRWMSCHVAQGEIKEADRERVSFIVIHIVSPPPRPKIRISGIAGINRV